MSGTVGQLFSKLSAVVASPASSGLQNHHKMVIDRKTIEKTWKYMDKLSKSTCFSFFQRKTQNHPWAKGPWMVLCPSGFINFALPKNLCTYQDIPFFKHPIGGGQLPKNVCKML